MPPRMKTEAENIGTATGIVRAYIKAMLRADPDGHTFRVTDIRRRLNKSSYECYTMIAIAALVEEGLIKTYPESMHSLVYLVPK